MTNTILTQTNTEVNTRNESEVYLPRGITDSIEHSCCLHKRVATEILLDPSDELATWILASHGLTTAHKDGWFSRGVVWRFYGVSEKYFHNICSSYLISQRNTPEFVERRKIESVTSDDNTVFYAPRMVLAFSAIMQQGRNIPNNSMVKKVYESIKSTRYYAIAEKRNKAYHARWSEVSRCRMLATDFVQSALNDCSETICLGDNGKVEISMMGLAKLLNFILQEEHNRNNEQADNAGN